MSPKLSDVYHYLLPFLYGLTHVSKVGSVFTTLAVSLERYFAVCRPLWIRIRRMHPALYIVLVTVFAFAFNVPKFLEFEVRYSVNASNLKQAKWLFLGCNDDATLMNFHYAWHNVIFHAIQSGTVRFSLVWHQRMQNGQKYMRLNLPCLHIWVASNYIRTTVSIHCVPIGDDKK